MYSEESVHTRFAASAPHSANSDHLIAVKYIGGQWFYDNNTAYVAFTPLASDLLLAAVDFGLDTVTDLKGTSSVVNGIESGYADGDLVFTPNQWGGQFNSGEFGVSGTSFIRNAGVLIVTVDALSTTATTPSLTGTVGDPNATLQVTVDGTS